MQRQVISGGDVETVLLEMNAVPENVLAGYRAAMFDLPAATREEAPRRLRDWLPQRTRWFKGWMQTWLVHMRNPVRTRADLGRQDYWLMQVVFAGAIGSALFHPLMLGFVAWTLLSGVGPDDGALPLALASIDVANIVMAYAAFHMLATRTAPPAARIRPRRSCISATVRPS